MSGTLFDVLAEIEKRPGMFLGGNTPGEWRQSLQLWLFGYEAALSVNGVQEPGTGFLDAFWKYLIGRFGRDWDVATGPFGAIFNHTSEDDAKAWTLMWKLIGEYRESLPKEGSTCASR